MPKKFLTIIDHNKHFNDSYPANVRKKCAKLTLMVISHRGFHLNSFPKKSCQTIM